MDNTCLQHPAAFLFFSTTSDKTSHFNTNNSARMFQNNINNKNLNGEATRLLNNNNNNNSNNNNNNHEGGNNGRKKTKKPQKKSIKQFEVDIQPNVQDPTSPLASPSIPDDLDSMLKQRILDNEEDKNSDEQYILVPPTNVSPLISSFHRPSQSNTTVTFAKTFEELDPLLLASYSRKNSDDPNLFDPSSLARKVPMPEIAPYTGSSSTAAAGGDNNSKGSKGSNNSRSSYKNYSSAYSSDDIEAASKSCGSSKDDDDDGDDTTTHYGSLAQVSTVLEKFEENAQEVWNDVREVTKEAWADFEDRAHYDWTEFYPQENAATRFRAMIRFTRWIATGFIADTRQSDEDIQENLNSLARLISLLREYHERFGMPTKGGPKDQEYILREATKDLYGGGAPIWALEPVLKKVAEGLTGRRGVDFFMLPRHTFIFAPSSGATILVPMARGYDMQKLDAMEAIAVRLASYASNTSSVSSIPARLPNPSELRRAFRTESLAGFCYTKEEMADEILTLASEAEGLFFYINSRHDTALKRENNNNGVKKGENAPAAQSELNEFWTVEDHIKELFSRLAAIEAITNIDKIDVGRKVLYSPSTVLFFRFAASAGACAFWFNGSWVDIFVSGVLAIVVAWIAASPILSKQERIIIEALASFVVGLVSGLVAMTWPAYSCFGAMAISGVLDLLQGFRVVYSIIEIMSRHTVTGGADFLEGVFFTSLIAYFLKFGELAAIQILGEPESSEYMQTVGISPWWNLFFLPLAAFSWSGLFNPHYVDLPFMAAHGILGYVVSWQFSQTSTSQNINNFIAAMCVTFSAGLISRFTGRQALGNTIAGIYVLLPGAYLVDAVYKNSIEGFLFSIILRAIIIGIGAWTGTILCSPTLLGTNRGFIQQSVGSIASTMLSNSTIATNETSSLSTSGSSSDLTRQQSVGSGTSSNTWRKRDKSVRRNGTGALLFF